MVKLSKKAKCAMAFDQECRIVWNQTGALLICLIYPLYCPFAKDLYQTLIFNDRFNCTQFVDPSLNLEPLKFK